MLKFFSNHRIIFYFINFSLIFLYLYPGSILGQLIYGSKKIQPQITPDFIISSNHFYVFALLTIIGFLTFFDLKLVKILVVYLILLSIILECLHLFIPGRTFQWSDLFGNLIGVIVVFFIKILINKYGVYKK
jgi:VanZ family protein